MVVGGVQVVVVGEIQVVDVETVAGVVQVVDVEILVGGRVVHGVVGGIKGAGGETGANGSDISHSQSGIPSVE